jgi:Na+/H+ antiporter NhaA
VRNIDILSENDEQRQQLAMLFVNGGMKSDSKHLKKKKFSGIVYIIQIQKSLKHWRNDTLFDSQNA